MIRDYSVLCLFYIIIYIVTGTAGKVSLIGGHLAAINQFKYQVSLVNPGHGHACGGGIIADKFILTAAHCVVKPDGHLDLTPIIILAGTNDLKKVDKPAVIGYVDKIYVTVDFDYQNVSTTGDIAVLRLTESLSVWKRSNLKKLKLPSKRDKSYAGKIAMIAGFGQCIADLPQHQIRMSNHLLFSEADILTTQQCQDGYIVQKISDKHICARVKQYNDNAIRGTCLGDSGSPLVVKGKTIVGISSRGSAGCTEKVRAGIYTRVTSYLDFIRNAMKDKETGDMRTLMIP